MKNYDTSQGDAVAHPEAVNGIPGEVISVRTDLGNRVTAWRATGNPTTLRQFFCHGFSLDTYTKHRYSVYSGKSLMRVLTDEYIKIGSMTSPGVATGDIIIMWQGFDPVHSAVIVNRVLTPAGQLNEGLTLVNSKFGTGHIKWGASYATVKHLDYPKPTLVEVYRAA